jgi:hypothetical protein
VYLDLSSARFCVGSELLHVFFVGIVVDKQVALLVVKEGVMNMMLVFGIKLLVNKLIFFMSL